MALQGLAPSGFTAAVRYAFVTGLARSLGEINPATLAIGIPATLFLFWVRKGLKPALQRLGMSPRAADISAKAGPVVAVATATEGGRPRQTQAPARPSNKSRSRMMIRGRMLSV